MQPAFNFPHTFSEGSILAHAPADSGVYGISNAREWIYIGESDNIQQRLLEHVAESGTPVQVRRPTGFSFEVCDRGARYSRQDLLILKYEPVCNRQSHRSAGRKD